MTYQPKVGDRVRVVIEGPVHAADDALGRMVELGSENFRFAHVPVLANEYARAQGLSVSVECLARTEPEWRPGDVVRDERHQIWQASTALTWRGIGQTGLWPRDLIPGPLTLLVRDGKPVQS